MEFIKHVLKSWDGMPIFDRGFVDGLTIHMHSHRTILLRHKKGGYGKWTQTLTYKTFGDQLLHLSLNL